MSLIFRYMRGSVSKWFNILDGLKFLSQHLTAKKEKNILDFGIVINVYTFTSPLFSRLNTSNYNIFPQSSSSSSLIFVIRIHVFAASFLVKWAVSLGGCPSIVNKSKPITSNVIRSYSDIHQIFVYKRSNSFFL